MTEAGGPMLAMLAVILGHKKTVILAALAGMGVSAVISLVLPARYVSSAAFIPGGVEQELTGRGSFLDRLGAFSDVYATFVRVGRNFVIDFIVRSRLMAGLMDDRFDLREMYRVDTLDKVRREFGKRTHVNVRDEGVIVVAVEARDPVLARDMTAALVEFADSILADLTLENVRARRRFFEQELQRREKRVAAVDSALLEFMNRHGIYQIEAQARAAFEVTGLLAARMSALEVERRIVEMTAQRDTPDLLRLDIELEKLAAEIAGIIESGGGAGLLPPLDAMPALASQYFGLLAERVAQEFALNFVLLKLEDARISAERGAGVLRVIDPPFVPERRAWPKRKQIVILLTLATVFWTCFALVVRERMRRPQREAGREPVS